MSTIDWTTERTNALIALWNEGVSTSEIGRRLDVTKNAVVGKVHRLGLKKRASPIRATSGAATDDAKAERPRQSKQASAREDEVIRLDGLTSNMCSWPEGEPGTADFHFCGNPVLPDKPYCAAHCARAYVRTGKGARGSSADKNAETANAAA